MLKDVLLTRATVLRSQENSATIASLIETCKPNAVDPQSYLTAKRTAIVNSHKQSRIDEQLLWKESQTSTLTTARLRCDGTGNTIARKIPRQITYAL